MHSPGESLKQEREARGKTIEEMAEATGIRLDLLTALEQEAFDSLPGRAFGKLYIRAYAEVLGFDPRPVIEAYDRALRVGQAVAPTPAPARAPRPVEAALARWRRERVGGRTEADVSEEPEAETLDHPAAVEEKPVGEPIDEPAPVEAQPEAETAPEIIEEAPEAELEPVAVEKEPAPELMAEPTVQAMPLLPDPVEELLEEEPALPIPVEAVSPARPPVRSRRWLMASLLLLVLLPLMAYLIFSTSETDPPPVAAQPAPAEAIPPPPPSSPSPPAAEPPRTPPRTQTPAREASPSTLTVTESGVGLRLVGMRLEGEGDRFRPGQRVTFATRVLGGRAGEHIRHVWLRDGRVEQSIRLRLGASSWRTHSNKTLGRPGAWAVEARDEQGRVLARADLTVAP